MSHMPTCSARKEFAATLALQLLSSARGARAARFKQIRHSRIEADTLRKEVRPREFPLQTIYGFLWINGKDTLDRAELYFKNELLAVLAPSAKPGWCRNAVKDGPLAKVLLPSRGE